MKHRPERFRTGTEACKPGDSAAGGAGSGGYPDSSFPCAGWFASRPALFRLIEELAAENVSNDA